MTSLQAVLSILHKTYPDLQDELLTYVESVLKENADNFESVEELKDSIEHILSEVDSSKSDDDVLAFCQEIYDLLVHKADKNKNQPILLENPISISDLMEKNKIEDEINQYFVLKSSTDVTKNNINDQMISENLAKVEESKLKRTKKKQEDLATLHVSQQFNKNTAYDNNESSTLTNFTVDNFDLSFGSKVLLKEATISIAVGRRYGFVGRNGLGKSTLLKAIGTGELKMPTNITVLLVEQEVIGDDTKAVESVLQADIIRSSLLQEMEILTKSNCSKSSERLLEVYQKLELIEADKAPSKASKILKGLGFTPEMQLMSTREFSGGWRMRLSLAKALFSQPDLLLLDEPTNMLDMKATFWLEEYLKTWSKSLIVVSHDQKFLDAACTDILFLHNQKIEHYKCNFSQFETARTIKLIAQQKEYETQKELRDHMQQFIDRFRTYASRAALVQSKIKALERMPVVEAPEKEKKVQFEFPECDKLSPPIIQILEMKFGYNEKRTILDINELTINKQSRICIVGENGAGKTTLLKLLMNDLEPQSGLIRRHKNLRIGFFSQHHVDQLTLTQNSLEFLQTKYPGYEPENYRSVLGKFGIQGDAALRPIGVLSGGQKSRVAFAMLSMRTPNFLVLDEPTNHLDMQTISALADAINKFPGGIVLVSHDERLISNVCKELWLVERNSNVSIVDGGISKYREMILKELENE